MYETADGTAVAGADYVPYAPKRLYFSAGVVRKTLTVKVRHDTLVEGDETMIVRLSAPVGGTIDRAEATGTIIDND